MPLSLRARKRSGARLAEAALKGVGLEKLVSVTVDGVSLGPFIAAARARALCAATRRAWKALCPARSSRRRRFQRAGSRGTRRRRRRVGDRVRRQRRCLWLWARALRIRRACTRLRRRAIRRRQAGSASTSPNSRKPKPVAALVERSGGEMSSVDIAFGLDPLGGRARGRARGPGRATTLRNAVAELRRRGFAGPFAPQTRGCVHDAGGTPGAGARLRAFGGPRLSSHARKS